MNNGMRVAPLMLSAFLAGCVNLSPDYKQADAPMPTALPIADEQGADAVSVGGWEDLIVSPELERVIALALENNRDLRAATARIAVARSQYGITRAARLPSVAASGGVTETGTFGDPSAAIEQAANAQEGVSAQLGVTAFELDFFGRVASLNEAALQSYLSTVEGERSTKIALISSVAQAWLTLAADQELLRLAQETIDSQTESLNLTNEMFDSGVVTEIDVRRASASVETARAQLAQYTGLVRQDLNALRFIVGTDLPDNIAESAQLLPSPVVNRLAVGQSSALLLNRPDVLAAERSLRAAYANIGAARAAYFPSISLTGSAGYSSNELDGLFDGGIWSVGPKVSLPIFDAGNRKANLGVSKANRDLALAQYERAIQTAFRETADALATAQTVDERIDALRRLVEDTSVTLNLSQERFRVGIDDYLSVLDAQRDDYTSRQQLISAELVKALNVVTLFQALGGASTPAASQ
ncbi:MAG: efflux transporter outer membrane subunit [Hyphomonas oceanitis]|uniref:NodT family RND efflux system outer membrane lipoprotein n=1 Tax=Hyphomonas oceanitis SCH89 TaxID=1280953 RepID=A0A059G664_9PROT|nr:efflux transporter outer membrane subunit [Hyphomonas oceanitis]KDA01943.1 NodT family RND efflux system outer membrane lipoprotein [Hyphomonas oceanitis SCH89]